MREIEFESAVHALPDQCRLAVFPLRELNRRGRSVEQCGKNLPQARVRHSEPVGMGNGMEARGPRAFGRRQDDCKPVPLRGWHIEREADQAAGGLTCGIRGVGQQPAPLASQRLIPEARRGSSTVLSGRGSSVL